jgi:hypothetical protein
MSGLVPAIHVLTAQKQDVDARHKAGHDEIGTIGLLIGRAGLGNGALDREWQRRRSVS